MTPGPRRQGAALVLVLVVFFVVSATTAAIAWQITTNRRVLRHRHDQLQAAWLARTGIELACARLLTAPAPFNEVYQPIPSGTVRLEVKPLPRSPETYRIECQSRYPTDETDSVVRRATRTVRRIREGGRVRIEFLARSPSL